MCICVYMYVYIYNSKKSSGFYKIQNTLLKLIKKCFMNIS